MFSYDSCSYNNMAFLPELPVLPNQFYMYKTSYLFVNNFKIRKIRLEKDMRCEVFSIVTYVVNSQ